MKKNILLLLASMVIMQVYGQKKTELIKVKDWGQRIIRFIPDYWKDEKSDSIIKQIGKTEYDKFIEFSDAKYVPGQMTTFSGGVMKNRAEIYAKMNKLKMYRIATFKHLPDGDIPMAILRVPYSENKDWDPEAKWDVVYFVIPVRALVKE